MLPKKLQDKLDQRKENNSLRSLGTSSELIDFSSNDYLGFSSSVKIFNDASEILEMHNLAHNGATGSRLLSGNHKLYEIAEAEIAKFHKVESALIFNSGYDANLGFFSSVPQRGDIIFYDELCHASIRDGIQMSNAKSYKFKHNDLDHLKEVIHKLENSQGVAEVYIVTESIFSMDGDHLDLIELASFCKENGHYLVVDEAHAVGVFGSYGEGLVQELGLEDAVFARLVTFGKALGCHGAAILGSADLSTYLINFARSFVYTTGLSPHSVASILSAYRYLASDNKNTQKLNINIAILRMDVRLSELNGRFIESKSAIHSCIIPGNDRVKEVSELLKKEGFDVKPILSPTVRLGEERLRICLHSYNKQEEIKKLLSLIANTIEGDFTK